MVQQIVLQNPPTGDVKLQLGEKDSTFKLSEYSVPQLNDGDVHLKVLYFSNDPTQRNWIGARQNSDRTYYEPIKEGEIIKSLGLGKVVDSKSGKYQKDDLVVGLFGWAEELVVNEASITTKVDQSLNLPLPLYLSSLGMTGLTAYFGLTEVGHLKEGQSVLVSAASGATGSMVVQIAKHIFKAEKVVGIAGSDEKCKWVESIGADYCVNYKDADWKSKLDKYLNGYTFDVYYDNVGGDQLSYALGKVKRWGHVIACGAISGYNDISKSAVTTWFEIISNRITVQGFIVFDFAAKFNDAVQVLSKALKEGKIETTQGSAVVDVSSKSNPLAEQPSVWYRLFTDEKPIGKLITKIA